MKVLFVVTAFYPEQAIGAIRLTKLAKYFQSQDVSLSVISLAPPPWAMRDESLWFEGLDDIDWKSIDQSPLFNRVFQRARVATVGMQPAHSALAQGSSKKTLKGQFLAWAQLGYALLKAIDWSLRVRKYVLKRYGDANYDYVLCSYPSFASAFAGIQVKRLGVGKRLALDFRDAVCNSSADRFSLLHYLQGRLLSEADLRLYVSNGLLKQMVGDKDSDRDFVAKNGFDRRDAVIVPLINNKETKDPVLRFVYTGAMYGGKRDLRPFFEAIAAVLAKSAHDAESLSVEYAGAEGSIFLSQARQFGLHPVVIDHGVLERRDALELQQHADVCLLATWNSHTEQGVLTGKIFEYFASRKPILAIVGGDLPGSEIAEVIASVGAGHSYEAATPDAIIALERWIERALDRKSQFGVLEDTYNKKVNNYDISQIAVSIIEKMDEQLSRDQTL